MSKLDIIGLAGKSGTGKDHIAKTYFQPLGFKSFSFAWHPKVFLVGKGLATHEEVFVTKPPIFVLSYKMMPLDWGEMYTEKMFGVVP
jgi:hypothetical protein